MVAVVGDSFGPNWFLLTEFEKEVACLCRVFPHLVVAVVPVAKAVLPISKKNK